MSCLSISKYCTHFQKLRKGSVNEIAIELMELKGISTEDGVAELRQHTEKAIDKLCNHAVIRAVKEKHEKGL